MVGTPAVPERSAWRSLPATLGPVAVVGSTDAIGLVGWIAGAFVLVAVVATLYLTFVGLRHDRHGPVEVRDDAGDDGARPDEGEADRDADG